MRGTIRRIGGPAPAAGLSLVSAAPANAASPGPDLETYLALVDRYRAGEVEASFRQAGSWGPVWVREAARRLLDSFDQTHGRTVAAQVRSVQGAFLLHTTVVLADGDLRLREIDHDAHVDAALRLLHWLRDRFEDEPGAWPAEARGLSPRDFYLALVSVELVTLRFKSARRLAEESLAREKHDPEMQLAAGCAEEMEALSERLSNGRWPDGTLREAEVRFRRALEEDPTLQEARLRLGWVLVRRGRPDEALPFLEAVTDAPRSPSRGALAWLFLGAAHEALEEWSVAEEAYRRSVELAPDFQAVHLALAHALEHEGGEDAARAVLAPFILDRRPPQSRLDPWSGYPFGPPEIRDRAFETLRETLCRR